MTFDTTFLSYLVSGLIGAVFALTGARWLEGRKEKRHRATVLNAVRLELALLASSVELPAKEGKRNRIALRKPLWDKFSSEVTVSVSEPLAKVLFLHMEDEFDRLQTAYDLLVNGEIKDYNEEVRAKTTLIGWAAKADGIMEELHKEIHGWASSWVLWSNFFRKDDTRFTRLVERLEKRGKDAVEKWLSDVNIHKEEEMPNWEYKVLYLRGYDGKYRYDGLEEQWKNLHSSSGATAAWEIVPLLNELGAKGWELVGTIPGLQAEDQQALLFKRP